MNVIIGIFVGLIVLTILVALHELGHALAAKKNGVKLEEFGIGFPPNAKVFYTKTDKILPKNTKVSLNWIPLGGFVKLQGEHDSDNKSGDYGATTFWGKTQILLAGVTVNWVIAIFIFTGLAFFGLPKLIPNQFYVKEDSRIVGGELSIINIVKDSPAEKAGLKIEDKILKLANYKVLSPEEVSRIAKDNAGKSIEAEILRDGVIKKTNINVKDNNDDGKGFIGLASSSSEQKIYSTWSAPIVGVGTTFQLSVETFKGLGNLCRDFFGGIFNKFNPVASQDLKQQANSQLDQASKTVAGPGAILGVIFPKAAESGFGTIMLLMAIISLSLACMNILPIPALDGGRWLMTFIFRKILNKPLTPELEERINVAGFLFLIGLSLVVIVVDIFKLF